MRGSRISKVLVAGLAAFVLAFSVVALTACGGGSSAPSETQVAFQNDTGTQIDGFYISPTTDETWGEKLNGSAVSAGSSINISVSELADGAGAVYDIGAINHDSLVYEVYEVTVNAQDVIALSANGDEAVVTVTSADGSSTTYTGYTHIQE